MAKLVTPQMEKINAKNLRRNGEKKRSTPTTEAWKRLKRNRLAILGLVIIFLLLGCVIFADVIAPYGYDDQDYNSTLLGPSIEHLMGTDNFGRDIFSRVIYGARISLLIGICCVCISVIVGGTLGAISAYYGGKIDNFIMRFMDIFQAIPSILLAISIAAALGTGIFNLMLAISLSTVPLYARVVRGAVLTVKERGFVEAARASGAFVPRQILIHMLPNAMGPIIVQATFSVAASILTVASLSFIGLGISPPTPEWGSMLSAGRQYMSNYPHVVIFPGFMIMLTVFALNLFGDGLRDALDPRMK